MNQEEIKNLLAKQKSARRCILCYTCFAQVLMLAFAGLSVASYTQSSRRTPILISSVIHFVIAMAGFGFSSACQGAMRDNRPKYIEAQEHLQKAICLMFTFAVLQGIGAVALFFLSDGEGLWFCLILFSLASPQIFLVLSAWP